MLTRLQYDVLAYLHYDSEYCMNYKHLVDFGTRKELEPIIKQLKEMKLIEFHRGLMTEDGDVAGSGWCRNTRNNPNVEIFLTEYEQANGVKRSEG